MPTRMNMREKDEDACVRLSIEEDTALGEQVCKHRLNILSERRKT
jgi:hypothetical protein